MGGGGGNATANALLCRVGVFLQLCVLASLHVLVKSNMDMIEADHPPPSSFTLTETLRPATHTGMRTWHGLAAARGRRPSLTSRAASAAQTAAPTDEDRWSAQVRREWGGFLGHAGVQGRGRAASPCPPRQSTHPPGRANTADEERERASLAFATRPDPPAVASHPFFPPHTSLVTVPSPLRSAKAG